jgi:hypothetical protein
MAVSHPLFAVEKVRLASLAVGISETFNGYSQSEVLNQLSHDFTFKIFLGSVEHEHGFYFVGGDCGYVVYMPVYILFFLLMTVNPLFQIFLRASRIIIITFGENFIFKIFYLYSEWFCCVNFQQICAGVDISYF